MASGLGFGGHFGFGGHTHVGPGSMFKLARPLGSGGIRYTS